MSHQPAVRFFGTKDANTEELNLDGIDFDALEEKNNAKIDAQDAPEADNDCGDACKI